MLTTDEEIDRIIETAETRSRETAQAIKEIAQRVAVDPGAHLDPDAIASAARMSDADIARLDAELMAAGVRDRRPWRKLVRAARRRPLVSGKDDRAVVVTGPDIHRVVDETDAAMCQGGDVFHRLGVLVGVVEDDRPRAAPLSVPALRTSISRRVLYLRHGPDGPEPCGVPQNVTTSYHAGPTWGLPELRGIATGAILRPNGSVTTDAKYDRSTGWYLVDPIPVRIGKDPAAAYATICEPLIDVAWASDADRAAWVCLVCELVSRHLIDGPTPMYVLDADAPGAGKGLMVEVAHLIATGRHPAAQTWPDDDAERRKTIMAAAIEARSLIFFDNLKSTLGGAALEAATTARTYGGRILGVSSTAEAEIRATWAATGNAVRPTSDMARRVIVSRIRHRGEAYLWTRPDLAGHVIEHRAQLLSAALTIVATYIRAGRPQALDPHHGYYAWSRTIRDAVHFASGVDPTDAWREWREEVDTETLGLRAVLASWPRMSDNSWRVYRAGELADMIRDEYDNSDFTRALEELVRSPTPAGVSHALRIYRGRPITVAGHQLSVVYDAIRNGVGAWTVTST